jgi:hypothetical protein
MEYLVTFVVVDVTLSCILYFASNVKMLSDLQDDRAGNSLSASGHVIFTLLIQAYLCVFVQNVLCQVPAFDSLDGVNILPSTLLGKARCSMRGTN